MRPLRLILICVLLGAVTTVGVAWAVPATFDRGKSLMPTFSTAQIDAHADDGRFRMFVDVRSYRDWRRIQVQNMVSMSWMTEGAAHPVPPPAVSRRLISDAVIHDSLSSVSREARSLNRRCMVETGQIPRVAVASGWPHLAMYGFYTDHWTAHGLLERRNPGEWFVSYPLRVRPLGFALDAVFYGCIWFPLVLCPGFVRRRLRQRRGLCPSCGYDLQGTSGTCPECGNQIDPVVS